MSEPDRCHECEAELPAGELPAGELPVRCEQCDAVSCEVRAR